MSTKTLLYALLASVVFAFLFLLATAGNAQTYGNQIVGKTMDDHIAIINGQHPPRQNDHGVRILNGQTGQYRRETAFDITSRDLCAKAYPNDELGQTLCRDNERRVRSDQYDRWMGIGQYRNDYAPRRP